MSHLLVRNVRTDDYQIYIGRDSRLGDPSWGNAFHVRDHGREGAIRLHREWLHSQPALRRKAKRELRGQTLGCHCAPANCHGETLAVVANEPWRILVCGPRDFGNALYVHCVMLSLKREYGDFVLIEGEANGVDILSRKSAQVLGLHVERYPADWRMGRGAGLARNRDMLEQGKPDICVPIGYGRGTANMAKIAQEAGVLVVWRVRWWRGASAKP